MKTSSLPVFNALETDSNEGDGVSIVALINLGAKADFTKPFVTCDACGSPRQRDVDITGTKHRVPIICKCRADALRAYEEQEQAKVVQRRLDKFKAYSLMDDRFLGSTFENWVTRDDNRELLNLGKKYCENWETMLANNRGLLIHGVAGNGKTFFSFSIANELYRQGKAVMAISVTRILDIIKDSYASHGEMGEIDVFNTIGECSLLILDDLGVEYKTNWSYEKLYSIIDTRYRANKPTIITTNLHIDKKEKIDELRDNLSVIDAKSNRYDPSDRIYNRIVEMCAFVEVRGESWRVQKGRENKRALFDELGLTGRH